MGATSVTVTDAFASLAERAVTAWGLRALQVPAALPEPSSAPAEEAPDAHVPPTGTAAAAPGTAEQAPQALGPRKAFRHRAVLAVRPRLVERPAVCRRPGCREPATDETLALCEGHLATYRVELAPLLADMEQAAAKRQAQARARA